MRWNGPESGDFRQRHFTLLGPSRSHAKNCSPLLQLMAVQYEAACLVVLGSSANLGKGACDRILEGIGLWFGQRERLWLAGPFRFTATISEEAQGSVVELINYLFIYFNLVTS